MRERTRQGWSAGMRRILVLGPGGSGKSTLSVALSSRTGIPVTHLDVLFWGPGWTPRPVAEAVAEVKAVVAGDRWIIDGSFLDHADEDGRFALADTVVFLDMPRRVCLWRVVKRLVRDRRRRRPDLPEGCWEGFDPSLLRWIWRYPRKDRPQVLDLLAELPDTIEVHHLRSRSQVREFVSSL